MVFKGDIHVSAQSCTWKELTNYKKFERLLLLLQPRKTRHFNPITLDIACSVHVGECFLCWMKWFRHYVEDLCFHHVATFPEVNNLQKNAFEQKYSVHLLPWALVNLIYRVRCNKEEHNANSTEQDKSSAAAAMTVLLERR